MDKIIIERVNGKWLINGKSYIDLNDEEKQFFDEFILAMKYEYEQTKIG